MNIDTMINNVKSISNNKRFVAFFLLIMISIIGILVWYGFNHKSVTNINTGIVAEVNGEKLFTDDFIPYIKDARAKLTYENVLKRKKEKLTNYKVLPKALNDMISTIVQVQKAKEYKVSLSADDIKQINNKHSDTSDVHIQKYYQDIALAGKVEEKIISEEKKSIPENEIKAFYEKFKDKFISWPKYNVQQIIISTLNNTGKPISQDEKDKAKSNAQQIFEQIKNGASFEEMAKLYSSDDKTNGNGGYTGLIELDNLNRQIVSVIPDIKIGELRLEESPNAYIVFRLVEKTDKRLETLDEARDEIEYALSQSLSNENSYENTVNNWVKQSNIIKHFDILGSIDTAKLK